jgi:hypothetical protein
VAVDIQQLKRHFSSLSDEGFAEIRRDDLVSGAQRCYDEEVARRQSARPVHAPSDQPTFDPPEPESDWLSSAACVCTFEDNRSQDGGAGAEDARLALDAAGIPSSVTLTPGANDRPGEWRVLVPAAQELHAMSVLDCEVFNPRAAAEWRTHLELLSDRELKALDIDTICAGFLDRAARLRAAYLEEQARRATGQA